MGEEEDVVFGPGGVGVTFKRCYLAVDLEGSKLNLLQGKKLQITKIFLYLQF